MTPDYWHKQHSNQPLFPTLEWSKPENKQFAGKLAIIGGNLHGFSAPALAYREAEKAGIGTVRVLLPDALEKTLGRTFTEGEFGSSTPSGSFSQRALGEVMQMSEWADAVLIAGDLGKNSEAAILLETFLKHYDGPLTLAQDSVDYFLKNPHLIINRPHTTLVLSFRQLQQLAAQTSFSTPITSDMDLLRLVETLHLFTTQFLCHLVLRQSNQIIVAVTGEVSTTKLSPDDDPNTIAIATHVTVWGLQHPSKTFEAFTTSLLFLGR